MCEIEPSVDTNDRASLIRWLVWNDPNGCYTDAGRDAEGIGRASLEELQQHYRRQTLTCAACCELFDDDETETPRPDPSYPSRTLLYHPTCAEAYDRIINCCQE